MTPTFARSPWATGDRLNKTNLNAERNALLQWSTEKIEEELERILPDAHLERYGLSTALMTPDGAIDTAKAAHPGGAILLFPPGVWTVNGAHDLTAQPWFVKGSGSRRSILQRTIDATNAMFVLWRSGQGAGAKISDIQLRGPGVGGADVIASNVGSAPTSRGVVLRDHCTMEDCIVGGFQAGAIFDGNHQTMRRSWVRGNRWNAYYSHNMAGYSTTIGTSGTHGNQDIENCDLTLCGEASIMIDGTTKMDSCTLKQTHMGWGPYGISATAKGAQEAAVINTTFIGCSFESVGERYMNDDGYNTANRRLWKTVRFYEQHDGPFEAASSRTGVVGTEMIRLGLVEDWEIHGCRGDSFNSSFPFAGTGAGCGFLAEKFNGFTFYNAEEIWGNAAVSGRPIFRTGGSAGNQFEAVAATILKKYVVIFARNNSGSTVADGEVAQPGAFGDFWAGGFGGTVQRYANATTPPIGRFAAAGPLTNGNIVPVVVSGYHNVGPCTDASVVAGSVLTADTTNGGVKRRTLATEPDFGYAVDNRVSNTVAYMFHGPMQPAI